MHVKDSFVYPKVKVRRQQQDQDDHHDFPDFSSPEEHEDDTLVPSIAKVPKSYIPNIAVSPSNDMPKVVSMPKISVLKEAEQDNREADDEDGKQHRRACSIPRPRAVLSSPDNDMVIGNRNRSKTERSSVLKNRKLPQNKHAQCKVIPNTTEDSVKTKKSKEDRDQNESNLKGSKGSVTVCPMPRRQIRDGKPAPKRT
ncbi:hypothetical protein TIFTF001_022458 [Ficus carica]|uniref:Uncharacterized protein n=1 Tax=Ficus carica TaxID=3494 RepID=A0AA88DEI6_FICCA|nr:hypothetical protein TIFTF001_022458 [Ficus carica]